jgi:hypothetical protein
LCTSFNRVPPTGWQEELSVSCAFSCAAAKGLPTRKLCASSPGFLTLVTCRVWIALLCHGNQNQQCGQGLLKSQKRPRSEEERRGTKVGTVTLLSRRMLVKCFRSGVVTMVQRRWPSGDDEKWAVVNRWITIEGDRSRCKNIIVLYLVNRCIHVWHNDVGQCGVPDDHA